MRDYDDDRFIAMKSCISCVFQWHSHRVLPTQKRWLEFDVEWRAVGLVIGIQYTDDIHDTC